ncbi:uncharacterized protein LOC108490921 [Nannospalax galili]|uniref:uncharacterized protein LOC108490921 n=1 Tax=Nannospalax galili TaxID=1026970 RepID=UPI000819A6A2|nr:uncharacterized protein LOC108490921 [Nannospalax galili]
MQKIQYGCQPGLSEYWIMIWAMFLMMTTSTEIKEQQMQYRWGIMSTFPLPMPVTYDAQVFPRLFTTTLKDDLDANTTGPCIELYNQSSAGKWSGTYDGFGRKEYRQGTKYIANVTAIIGWRPYWDKESNKTKQPKIFPSCEGEIGADTIPSWTGCQARITAFLDECAYTPCWNASIYPVAIATRMPRYIPVPVAMPGTLSLFRHKRDFGISAAIAVIIAGAAITGATVASAMTLSTSVQTATSVSAALDYQASANMQLQGGLMLVNQRIDLLQEQVDILWQLAQLGCE